MSYKTQERLIKAIDATASPPETKEEAERWVKRWQRIEATEHDTVQARQRAVNEITADEILANMRTQHHRMKGSRPVWIRETKRTGKAMGNPNEVRITSIGTRLALNISKATAYQYEIGEVKSVDVYRLSHRAKRMRIILWQDTRGEYALSGRQLRVCCSMALTMAGAEKGKRYPLKPIVPEMFEFEVDFSKPVEVG